MTTAAIRQKLYEYIRVADDKKVKAIFTMVEDELQAYEWWKDEEFAAELDKRNNDLKSGKVKGVSWDEMKNRIISSRHERKK